jgi:hypothetical protein
VLGHPFQPRQIERLCQRDVAFRVVARKLSPDHATIARFRQRHAEALKGLFTDILRLCTEAGLVKVGVVALDGTKMAADAALEANRTSESIRAEVETMLPEAESRDAEEDRLYGPEHRGDELPAALAGPRRSARAAQAVSGAAGAGSDGSGGR